MFEQFSLRLYEKAAAADYRLGYMNGTDIADTTHWLAQKVEMATLVTLHVISSEIKSPPPQGTGSLNLYILVGGNVPDFIGAEEYFGQTDFNIFWHLNLETGEITVPQGQPKNLFGLREMVESAFAEAFANSRGHTSFAEITYHSHQHRPRAKYQHPLLAYGLIFVNLVILLLMYLDGYQAGTVAVPVRYGAILADFVIVGGEWWRLFAAMFIHFGFSHFFANAFGILIFGTRLERYLGRRIFFIVYIFSGLAGSVVSLFNLHFFQPFAVSAGASGAVYGIVGAMLAYTRITKRSIEFITWYVMLIYIGLGMAMGFATPGIDNFAHIGGLLMGMLIGGIYAKFRK